MKTLAIVFFLLISSLSYSQSTEAIPKAIKTKEGLFRGAKFFRKDINDNQSVYNFRKRRKFLMMPKEKIPLKDMIYYQVYYDSSKKKVNKVVKSKGFSNPGKWL